MQLTTQQITAKNAALDWWRSGDERPLLIQGYAGTGKSTTIETIVRELTQERPAYMAFTNKAVRVLASKVNNSLYCGTIHSAIYFISWYEAYSGALDRYEELKHKIRIEEDGVKLSALLSEKRLMEERREVWSEWSLQDGFAWDREFVDGRAEYGDYGGGLIVVDECSMVRTDVGRDLAQVASQAGYRIIAVGDPGQLPPVVGRDYQGDLEDVSYFTERRCCVAPILTQVMRQGEGSAILSAATIARDGSTRLPLQICDGLAVLDRRRASQQIDPSAYDQVICGRHVTRRSVNANVRETLGRSGPPQAGDKMIMQKSSKNDGYSNGDIFTVKNFDAHVMTGILQDGQEIKFIVKQTDFDDEKETIAYAYAITCHKSQGSEFKTVLLHNEAYCFRDDGSKWLYTGVTRASEFLTVLQ